MTRALSHRVPRHLTIALLAGAALTACAGAQSASNQPRKDKEAKLKGSLDQPLGVSVRHGGQSGTNTTRIIMKSTEDDGSSYSVTINNDEITAEVNGQPVPADRIDRKGKTVIIKDEDGNTVHTFDLGVAGSHDGRMRLRSGDAQGDAFGNGEWTLTPNWKGAAAFSGAFEPPPVMLGITMTELDPSLVEELGVEADEVFVIDRVIEGLPAEQAGLKTSDVVIKINGKKPASQDRFRETLKDKKPGDTIELTIVRKGKEQNVSVKLAAFDQEKLSMFGAQGMGGADAPSRMPMNFNWSGDQGVTAEARKRIEEALRSLKENPDLKPDKMRQRAQDALEQALKSLEETKDGLAQRFYQFRSPRGGGGGQADVLLGDRPGQFFRVPPQPQQGQEGQDRDVARRIERIGDMLERLDKRLDEIEKRLDKSER